MAPLLFAVSPARRSLFMPDACGDPTRRRRREFDATSKIYCRGTTTVDFFGAAPLLQTAIERQLVLVRLQPVPTHVAKTIQNVIPHLTDSRSLSRA